MNRRDLLVCFCALAGCRRKRRAPEELVREVLLTLEEAVEEKDLGTIKAALSERFKGGEESDRRAAIGLLQLLFMRHPRIYLLVRVRDVGVVGPGEVRADLLVAMASVPLRDAQELPRVQADLHEFVVTFAEEEKELYRVVGASWVPARLEGFL